MMAQFLSDPQWMELKSLLAAAGGDVSHEDIVREGMNLVIDKARKAAARPAEDAARRKLVEGIEESADRLMWKLQSLKSSDPMVLRILMGADTLTNHYGDARAVTMTHFPDEELHAADERFKALMGLLETMSIRAMYRADDENKRKPTPRRGRKSDEVTRIACRVLLIQLWNRCPIAFRDRLGNTTRELVAILEFLLKIILPVGRDHRLAAQRALRREMSDIEAGKAAERRALATLNQTQRALLSRDAERAENGNMKSSRPF